MCAPREGTVSSSDTPEPLPTAARGLQRAGCQGCPRVPSPGTLMPAGVGEGQPQSRLLHGALGDGAAALQDLVR